VPVGRSLPAPAGSGPEEPAGSCIAVVATDLPLNADQLSRLARRAGLGLARTGSVAHHGSGEIFLAFSTGGRRPRGESGRRTEASSFPDGEINAVFAAAVEATEGAVVNALWAAPDVAGRQGRVTPGLPHQAVLSLLRAAGRSSASPA
jgi:D-aminopeptidase